MTDLGRWIEEVTEAVCQVGHLPYLDVEWIEWYLVYFTDYNMHI